MFPLKLIDQPAYPVPEAQLQKIVERKINKARKLSNSELKKRATHAPKAAGNRTVSSNQYQRNPWVSEYAKRRAGGICQLCGEPGPFLDKEGDPFLETHHIVWLSRDGEDSIENTVALCPNCHSKMHVLDLEDDKRHLKAVVI